jgi:hypothetical protein
MPAFKPGDFLENRTDQASARVLLISTQELLKVIWSYFEIGHIFFGNKTKWALILALYK